MLKQRSQNTTSLARRDQRGGERPGLAVGGAEDVEGQSLGGLRADARAGG